MAARKSAPQKQSKPPQPARRPLAEWTAGGLGLALTLMVVGYTVWEGLTEDPGPPLLSATAKTPKASNEGFVVPITVRNASHATAAGVEVRGVLSQAGQALEERHARLAYVPGRGEASGGLVFQQDPSRHALELSIEGYEDP